MHDNPEAWRQAHGLPVHPARPGSAMFGSLATTGQSGYMRAWQTGDGWEVVAISNPDSTPEAVASFTEWARMRLYRLITNGPDSGDEWHRRNGWLEAFARPVELPSLD